MPLYRPKELHELGVRAKKGLSQNFLIDGNILEKICKAAEVSSRDAVLEIGPGPGSITERLLEKGAHVIAIEKDPRLVQELQKLESKNLKIICADALKDPVPTLPDHVKLIANLPFHITTPLIQKFITLFPQIFSMTLVVQKEVALRMTAKKNTPLYSSFSLFIQAYSHAKFCFPIRPASFFPVPSVDCGVVHLVLRPFPLPIEPEHFFLLTRTAFGKRRKMLRSSLKELYGSDKVEAALVELGFKPTIRPQELSFEDFGTLFEKLNCP